MTKIAIILFFLLHGYADNEKLNLLLEKSRK
jgi:hypothetical protein